MPLPIIPLDAAFVLDTSDKTADPFPGSPLRGGSGLDVAFVVDVSGSMSTSYGNNQTRLDAAKAAISEAFIVLQEDPVNRAALIPFSDGATVAVPLTNDFTALSNGLNALTPTNGTNTWFGINLAVQHLSGIPANGNLRAVVVASDGESGDANQTKGSGDNLKAGHPDYLLFAVAINGGNLNTNELFYLGDTIGDGFFEAQNPQELADAFRTIAQIGGDYISGAAYLVSLVAPDMEAKGFRASAVLFESSPTITGGAVIVSGMTADITGLAATVEGIVPATSGGPGLLSAGINAARVTIENRPIYPRVNAPAVVCVANSDLSTEEINAAALALLHFKEVAPHVRFMLAYPVGRGTNRLPPWFTALWDTFAYVPNMDTLEAVARGFLFRAYVPAPTLAVQGTYSGGAGAVILTANV